MRKKLLLRFVQQGKIISLKLSVLKIIIDNNKLKKENC